MSNIYLLFILYTRNTTKNPQLYENKHGGGSFSFIARLKVKCVALYWGQFVDNLKVIILVFYKHNFRIKII